MIKLLDHKHCDSQLCVLNSYNARTTFPKVPSPFKTMMYPCYRHGQLLGLLPMFSLNCLSPLFLSINFTFQSNQKREKKKPRRVPLMLGDPCQDTKLHKPQLLLFGVWIFFLMKWRGLGYYSLCYLVNPLICLVLRYGFGIHKEK